MTDVLATTRCPQCVALVRPGQPWCTLCHADLRPAPERLAEEPQAAPPVTLTSAALTSATLTSGVPLADPLTAGLPDGSAGKHARHAASSAEVDAEPVAAGATPTGPSEGEIEAMIAELAAQSDLPLGGLGKQFASPGAKVALAVGVGVGVMVLLLVGAVVLAALFG